MRNRSYQIPPCPSYDVERLECWLGDLAQEGWLLSKDGFFCGFGFFDRAAPCAARYRFEAAKKRPSLWAEDGGNPSDEAIEINSAYGWEYITNYGEFHIYRTLQPGSRELNTDPAVQAIAMKKVVRRQISTLLSLGIDLLLYPLLFLVDGRPLIAMIELRSWYCLFTAVLALWILAGSLVQSIHYGRLRKKLRLGEPLDHRKDWRTRRYQYLIPKLLALCLTLVWICVSLHAWSNAVMETAHIPLAEYSGEVPFASMVKLTGAENALFEEMQMGGSFNYVKAWSDVLAPVNVERSECGRVRTGKGVVADGFLHVSYHEMATQWLAKELMREMVRWDARRNDGEPLDCPTPEGVDEAAVYTRKYYLPVIVFRKGKTVVYAYFSQYSRVDPIPLETWTRILAASIPSSIP